MPGSGGREPQNAFAVQNVKTLFGGILGGRISGARSRGWKEQGRRPAPSFLMEEVQEEKSLPTRYATCV